MNNFKSKKIVFIPSTVKRLFWDIDKENVDIRNHCSYIIKRIIDFGNIQDVKWMKKAYNDGQIKEVIKRSRGISRKSAYFWAAYFNIPKEEIKCLKKAYQKIVKPF